MYFTRLCGQYDHGRTIAMFPNNINKSDIRDDTEICNYAAP